MSARYVAVIGPADADPQEARAAEEVGRLLGAAGVVLICGGLGGVMEAACRGAKASGATTVGILPGRSRDDANSYVDVVLPSGLGEARNALVVGASDAVLAVGGGFGTLSEIGLALKMGKPVIGLGTWEIARRGEDPIVRATIPEEAVRLAVESGVN